MATTRALNPLEIAIRKSFFFPAFITITSAEFDKFLDEIDPAVSREVFGMLEVVDAGAGVETITLVTQQILDSPDITPTAGTARTNTVRIGPRYPVQGARILTGTDPAAIINVWIKQ